MLIKTPEYGSGTPEHSLWVADDDPIFLYTLSRHAASLGLKKTLQVFQDGEAILEALLQVPDSSFPNITLLDLNMPMANGWEVLERLNRIPKPKHCKLFVVSSSINPEDKQKALAYPWVDAYVLKPVGRKRLEWILSF